MSASSSGTSTPRGSVTPTPEAGPNPLTVGTHFVKQYYKVLSTTPEQIFRFYQPSSVLSQGVGSQPTQPATFESINIKDRFVLEGYESCPIRFEFEHGAIDAQVSVNGGVLLVVTGHIVYLDNTDQEENADVDSNKRKAFVHTFFLGSMTAGQKRSYYVHNDILRFLHDDEEKTVVVSNTSSKDKEVQLPVSVEEPPAEVVHTTPSVTQQSKIVLDGDEAPGGGVEESKEAMLEEEVEEVKVVEDDEDAIEPGKAEREMDDEPEPAIVADAEKDVVTESSDKVDVPVAPVVKEEESSKPAAKPTPGSWASLVASGGGTSITSAGGSTPATPTRGTPARPAASPASVKPKPSSSPVAKTPTPPTPPAPAAADSRIDGSRPKHIHAKRDPDMTLVIKNIDSETKESDVLGLFEPFAVKADAKVVGITVSAHKGIAFVDYDSAAPVLAAVEQHTNEAFQINGRVLDIYQKTLEQRNRRTSGRGSFRGGQPGNGSTSRGGVGSGGRQQFRRGGRGERDRGERDRRGSR